MVLAEKEEMRLLNRRYRQRNCATDVLSFAYRDEVAESGPFLGEIVLSPEIAFQQAASRRSVPEREVRMLLLHGMLHLLGYDHESDKGRMKRLQTKLMRRKFFMDGPSIAGPGAR